MKRLAHFRSVTAKFFHRSQVGDAAAIAGGAGTAHSSRDDCRRQKENFVAMILAPSVAASACHLRIGGSAAVPSTAAIFALARGSRRCINASARPFCQALKPGENPCQNWPPIKKDRLGRMDGGGGWTAGADGRTSPPWVGYWDRFSFCR